MQCQRQPSPKSPYNAFPTQQASEKPMPRSCQGHGTSLLLSLARLVVDDEAVSGVANPPLDLFFFRHQTPYADDDFCCSPLVGATISAAAEGNSIAPSVAKLTGAAKASPPKPPVEPKPPAPRTLSSNSATSTTSGVYMRSSTSCATRSPSETWKSVSAWLKRRILTWPR